MRAVATVPLRSLSGLVLLAVSLGASAQTLENKLRDQLRLTTGQLREAQAQLPQLQADKLALETERDALSKQLAAAKSELAGLRGRGDSALKNEAEARAASEQALARLKPELEEVSTRAKTAEAERVRLAAELGTSSTALKACTENNLRLYQTGQELVSAYQNIGVGQVLAAREPFLGLRRAELENAAQGFGDRLHEGRYVPVVTP